MASQDQRPGKRPRISKAERARQKKEHRKRKAQDEPKVEDQKVKKKLKTHEQREESVTPSSSSVASADPTEELIGKHVEDSKSDIRLLLVGRKSGIVYDSVRGQDGELISIGKLEKNESVSDKIFWDAAEVERANVIYHSSTCAIEKQEEEKTSGKKRKMETTTKGKGGDENQPLSEEDKKKKKKKKRKTKEDIKSSPLLTSLTPTSQPSTASTCIPSSTSPRIPLRPTRTPRPYGAYFPKAVKIPGATLPSHETCCIILFYQYAEPLWSEWEKQEAMTHMAKIGIAFNIGGRLRISREGFNATLSGTRSDLELFCEELRRWRPKNFSNTDFKFLDNLPADKAFKDLDLFPVQEIVHYGLPPDLADKISSMKGQHLPPDEYHKKMEEKDTVIIDVRNKYECDIGRFTPPETGAKFIDPLMRRSTDFQKFLEEPETSKQLEGKQVLMYCTGGVRCERASAMLNFKMGEKLKGVYQLHGGIEKYMKQFEGGGYWKGKNFVFDKRNANAAGELFEDPYEAKETGALPTAKCVCCNSLWDKYQGHRKCLDCGVPVIVCEECMSAKADGKRRCELCQREFHYLKDYEGAVARRIDGAESDQKKVTGADRGRHASAGRGRGWSRGGGRGRGGGSERGRGWGGGRGRRGRGGRGRGGREAQSFK